MGGTFWTKDFTCCNECGAMVPDIAWDKHLKWHENIVELFRLLRQRGKAIKISR